jgi:hypothetical protein
MTDANKSHSYLSCAAVARRLGLSRQRFWQLRRDGVFPQPQVDEETGRQYYSNEQVELCVDLRRRNVGMNGRVILFYSPRATTSVPKPKASRSKTKSKATSRHTEIIDALRGLGLPGVTDAQVDEGIAAVFPCGIDGVDRSGNCSRPGE